MAPPTNNPYGYKRVPPNAGTTDTVGEKHRTVGNVHDRDNMRKLQKSHRLTSTDYDVQTLLGIVYVIFLLVLTVFWPSISLILLTSIHAFLVILVGSLFLGIQGTNVMSSISGGTGNVGISGWQARVIGVIFGTYTFFYAQNKLEIRVYPIPRGMDLLAFHLRNPYSVWINMIHIIVLVLNMMAFLTVTFNESPPSTLRSFHFVAPICCID